MCKALLVGGVGGVGKSTLIHAVGRLLSDDGEPVAVVDTDDLAQFGPAPRSEPGSGLLPGFHDQLKCRNLEAVWANFRGVGARYAVVAGGIDSRDLRDLYTRALVGCTVQMVRLTAPTTAIRERLQQRAEEPNLQWHKGLEQQLARLTEQAARLDAARIEDFTVHNDRSSESVAREILDRAGWRLRSD